MSQARARDKIGGAYALLDPHHPGPSSPDHPIPLAGRRGRTVACDSSSYPMFVRRPRNVETLRFWGEPPDGGVSGSETRVRIEGIPGGAFNRENGRGSIR